MSDESRKLTIFDTSEYKEQIDKAIEELSNEIYKSIEGDVKMPKGLEIINQLETDLKYTAPSEKGYEHLLDLVLELKITLSKELQHLGAVDNSKPSEALEYLEEITNPVIQMNSYRGNNKSSQTIEYIKKVATIQQSLIKAQEQEKVLEIIKEKTVNILLLELAENVDEYNERIVPNGQLTQDEYHLLKRYFEND